MIARLSTKELLAESLKELAKFKAVDKITIKELTKNCGLTSPTFYNISGATILLKMSFANGWRSLLRTKIFI